MPRVPGTYAAAQPQVDEQDLMNAAAMMHSEGRLFQRELPIDEKDINRDPDIVGEPIRPGDVGNENKRFDERYPDLERDKENTQRGLDREKRMRERQEEFETDMFKSRRR